MITSEKTNHDVSFTTGEQTTNPTIGSLLTDEQRAALQTTAEDTDASHSAPLNDESKMSPEDEELFRVENQLEGDEAHLAEPKEAPALDLTDINLDLGDIDEGRSKKKKGIGRAALKTDSVVVVVPQAPTPKPPQFSSSKKPPVIVIKESEKVVKSEQPLGNKPEAARRPSRRHHTPNHAQNLHSSHTSELRREIREALKFYEKRAAKVAKREAHPTIPIDSQDTTTKKPETNAPDTNPVVKQSRPEFVKQQEALWGAKDAVKAEDIPEGELTYEQYLSKRPKAEAGDVLHAHDKNGRLLFYEATSGKRLKAAEVKETHEEDERLARQAADNQLVPQAAAAHYRAFQERNIIDEAHGEALGLHEVYTQNISDVVRANAEGEVLTQKDPTLRALHGLSQEIQALYKKKVSPEDFKKNIEPTLEDKKRLFGIVYGKLEADSADQRALDFITNDLGASVETDDKGATVLDIEPGTKIEGSAFVGGEKVSILDLIESPDGKVAYTIEGQDGEIRAVYANEVTFTRDYAVPEKERSRGERIKQWFKNEGELIRKLSGKEYFYGAMNRIGGWLRDRGVDEETMSYEQIEQQRRKNRRNNMIGAAAGAAAVLAASYGLGAWLSGAGGTAHGALQDGVGASGAGEAGVGLPGPRGLSVDGTGVNGGDWDLRQAAQRAFEDRPVATGYADYVEPTGISNTAYDIPSGQGGYALFENLGIDGSKWQANAQTLAERFPDDFRFVGGDVQIAHSGWLSQGAREFIESLKANR